MTLSISHYRYCGLDGATKKKKKGGDRRVNSGEERRSEIEMFIMQNSKKYLFVSVVKVSGWLGGGFIGFRLLVRPCQYFHISIHDV